MQNIELTVEAGDKDMRSSVDVKKMQSKLTNECMSKIKVIQESSYPGEKGQTIVQQQKMVVQGWYLMQKKALVRKASLMLGNNFINFIERVWHLALLVEYFCSRVFKLTN